MYYSDIRRYLKPYSIEANRTTTITHAFAAAIAPSDIYDDKQIREAVATLRQNPDEPLECVYCWALAETWDHLFATVKKKQFSGFGHRVGNLVPCCKPCNSKKGNKPWQTYLSQRGLPQAMLDERTRRIAGFVDRYGRKDEIPDQLPEYQRLGEIRLQILDLIREADGIARNLRTKGSSH